MSGVPAFSDYDLWKTSPPDDREPEEDDGLDLDDEYEEALGNCSQFVDDGFIVCGAIGSEHCDFECPFRCDLGKTIEQAEEEAVAEVTDALDATRPSR